MKEVADILLLTIALVFLLFASVHDIKKKEVPNWLSISLFFIALAIRGIAALLSGDASYFYWALVAAGIFFGVSELFCRTMIFGGGDGKIFIALAAVFATKPYFVEASIIGEPFLLSFFINSLLLGSIWGIFSAIYFFFSLKGKERKDFVKNFNEINRKKNTRILRVSFFVIAFLLLFFSIFININFVVIAVIMFLYPFLFSFIKATENKFLVKLVSPEKLTEGDWLAQPVKIGKKVLKKTPDGLSKKDILLLKKAKKKVYILEGLAFVPVLLVGLVVSLVFGNLLFLIIRMLI